MEAVDYNVMKWPPQCPDLNPIENVWGVYKQKKELYDVRVGEWNNLPQLFFTNLLESKHSRALAVRNRGMSTKY